MFFEGSDKNGSTPKTQKPSGLILFIKYPSPEPKSKMLEKFVTKK